MKLSDIHEKVTLFPLNPLLLIETLIHKEKMSKENLKRAGIAAAVVVAGVVALKLLPITVTLSAVVGFAGGVVCSYLWRTKSQK